MKTLLAFIWLRWRILINSIRGGHRRDRMEQVSRALALFVPLAILVVSFGSIVGIGILGYLGGALAAEWDRREFVVLILRISLAGLLLLVVIATLSSPPQSTLTRYTRLLLLPIRRQMLHLIEVLANLSDPWIAFVIPGLVLFAVGLAAYGRGGAAIIALVAALGLIAVVTTFAALMGFLVAWLLRSRRRGEMFTLIFVLVISLVSIVPAMIGEQIEIRIRDNRGSGGGFGALQNGDLDRVLPVWTRMLPTELYARAIRSSLVGDSGPAVGSLALLAVQAVLLFAASSAVHRRLLTSLEGDRSRRRRGELTGRTLRLPLVGVAASAVAWAQARTALRSVRGRLVVLLPGPMVAVLSIVFQRLPNDEAWMREMSAHGHLIVGAGAIFGLYAMSAFTMNMFGSDRAGLTLQLLGPISDRDLALGKVAGCAMTYGLSLSLAFVAALIISPNSSPYFWISVLLGALATFLLISPIGVWLSALFPVASDLSKTGSGGNPHAFPALVGALLVLVFSGPAALILIAMAERPALTVPLMGAWVAVAAAISLPLTLLASRAISARRENLALVAQGK